MKISIFIFLAFAFGFNAYALQAGPYRVAGKVQSFNEQTVTINSGVSLIEIPRKLVYERELKKDQMLKLVLLEEDKKKLIIKSLPKN